MKKKDIVTEDEKFDKAFGLANKSVLGEFKATFRLYLLSVAK